MFILKVVKVVCFDTLLQVFILKAVAVSVFLQSFARGDKSGLPQRHRGIELGDTATPGVPWLHSGYPTPGILQKEFGFG